MKLKIKTNEQTDHFLRAMASEAGLTPEALVRVAIYNLVACWLDSRQDEHPLAMAAHIDFDPHDGGDDGGGADRA